MGHQQLNALSQKIIRRYAQHFHVKIEQISVQGDHIHALIRTYRRSQFLHFFRVSSGQIAQVFEKEGLLKSVTDTPERFWGKGQSFGFIGLFLEWCVGTERTGS